MTVGVIGGLLAVNVLAGGASGQGGKVFGPPIPTKPATVTTSKGATTKGATNRIAGRARTTTKKATGIRLAKKTTATARRSVKTKKRVTVTTAAGEQLILDETGHGGNASASGAAGSDTGFTVEVIEGLPTTVPAGGGAARAVGAIVQTTLPRPSVLTVGTSVIATPSTTVVGSTSTTSTSTTTTLLGLVGPTTTTTLLGQVATTTTTAVAGATTSTTSTTIGQSRTPITGFLETGFRMFKNGIPQSDVVWCAALANNDATRQQGLKGRTNLSGYDAVLFSFGVDTTTAFTMDGTLIPLSLAWFGADGKFLGSANLAVVPVGQTSPTYSPPSPYRYALEVPQGSLGGLGVTSDSVLVFGLTCRTS